MRNLVAEITLYPWFPKVEIIGTMIFVLALNVKSVQPWSRMKADIDFERFYTEITGLLRKIVLTCVVLIILLRLPSNTVEQLVGNVSAELMTIAYLATSLFRAPYSALGFAIYAKSAPVRAYEIIRSVGPAKGAVFWQIVGLLLNPLWIKVPPELSYRCVETEAFEAWDIARLDGKRSERRGVNLSIFDQYDRLLVNIWHRQFRSHLACFVIVPLFGAMGLLALRLVS